jgi:hypothetical protein
LGVHTQLVHFLRRRQLPNQILDALIEGQSVVLESERHGGVTEGGNLV